jgi:hypothetical protein
MNGKRKCVNTTELHSVIQENETMWLAGKWIGRENVILSEISQSHKYHGLASICGTEEWEENQAHENEGKL